MNNIDCDQIILFGLVAIFAIYVYRNVLDPNQTQGFKAGGQNSINQINPNAMNNEIMAGLNNINNNINNSMNQNDSGNINQDIIRQLGQINATASRAESSANNARLAANNAAKLSATNAASAAMNANGAPIGANSNISGNDNSNSIPAIFDNIPEPNADPGGDSVPRSYNVGNSKTDSCFPQDTLTAEDLLPQEDIDVIKQFGEESIGDGVLKGIELLGAGYHTGVNSVGQSLRNGNLQLRSEPPNPQTDVSPWMNSTIGPDLQRRPLELTESCAKAQGTNTSDEVPGNSLLDTDMNNINLNSLLTGNNNNNNAPPIPSNSR